MSGSLYLSLGLAGVSVVCWCLLAPLKAATKDAPTSEHRDGDVSREERGEVRAQTSVAGMTFKNGGRREGLLPVSPGVLACTLSFLERKN